MFPLLCGRGVYFDHILIHCTNARVLWELLFAFFGVISVLLFSVRDIRSFVGKKRRKVWMAAPLCLFWSVGKERNRIAFENKELSIQIMKNTKSVIDEGLLLLINFFIGWVLDEG